jgi:YVTN family beta-propeller protein
VTARSAAPPGSPNRTRTRVPLRALGALVLLSAMAPAAHANAARVAFVINSGDASISLVDVDTHREVRRIPVLREPHHMALTPDGKSLLVGDTTGNRVFFLDPQTGDVRRQAAVSDPYQLTFSPDGRWLTIAGLARDQIDIYEAGTLRLLHRVRASSMPSHINYAPSSGVVYVSLQGSDTLIAIEVQSGRVLWRSRVGSTPAGVLWHGGRLLVGIMGADYIAVVDPADGRVERKVHTGRGAHVLFVPHDGSFIYVSNRVDGTISVLDPKTLGDIQTFKIPGGPDDLDFAPDGKVWVSRRWANSVAIVDPATGQFQVIPKGRSPHGIWLNTHPAGQAISGGAQ